MEEAEQKIEDIEAQVSQAKQDAESTEKGRALYIEGEKLNRTVLSSITMLALYKKNLPGTETETD